MARVTRVNAVLIASECMAMWARDITRLRGVSTSRMAMTVFLIHRGRGLHKIDYLVTIAEVYDNYVKWVYCILMIMLSCMTSKKVSSFT